MIKEHWKAVPQFENYLVSDRGRVKTINGKILEQRKQSKGYMMVSLSNNGQYWRALVHRLVAIVFIPNPDNLPQVNHINEIKTDNRVENLEWVSAKQNINHGTGHDRAFNSFIKNHPDWIKRKSCALVNDDGEIVEEYSDMTEAAKMNNMARNSVRLSIKNHQKISGKQFIFI